MIELCCFRKKLCYLKMRTENYSKHGALSFLFLGAIMYKTVVDKERNIGTLTDTTCSGGFTSGEIILILKIL